MAARPTTQRPRWTAAAWRCSRLLRKSSGSERRHSAQLRSRQRSFGHRNRHPAVCVRTLLSVPHPRACAAAFNATTAKTAAYSSVAGVTVSGVPATAVPAAAQTMPAGAGAVQAGRAAGRPALLAAVRADAAAASEVLRQRLLADAPAARASAAAAAAAAAAVPQVRRRAV